MEQPKLQDIEIEIPKKGNIVTGKFLRKDDEYIYINFGYKSEGRIDIKEFDKLPVNAKFYIKELENYFKKNKNNLSKESNEKIGKNTLRILDSNDPFDSEIIDLAPVIYQYLDEDTLDRYENLKQNLKNENIGYVENSKLVRGLDYYNDITFEFVYKATVLGGGGRYDKLAESLKLGNSAGVGVAFGVDRIINCINYVPSTKKIMLIGQNFDDIKSVSKKLDKSGIKYFLPIRKSKENTQYKEAIKNNVDYVINCTEKTIKNPKNSESFEFNIRNLKKLI